ncbi:MAG: tripartite tricarboxylate transporter substrate-binding protein [Planctomycetota bacterium]|nr:tripartite tricarboxylate transporter substrate-binding protein [Planctomycetota bacterium]
MSKFASVLTIIAASLLTWGCDRGGAYPNRPVTIICPWSAGGGTDGLSRQMAIFLEQKLGPRFNVINETGGEGVTGHSTGALATPDGYTLTMMTAELNMLHWRRMTPIDASHFRTLMVLNCEPAAIIVPADSPWKTVRDLEKAIGENPGKLKASGTAKGGTWHLAFAGWLAKAGLPISAVKWIPTRGASPSLQELMAKNLDLVCCSLPEAQALIQGGNLKGLGVMADERIKGFDDVKTFKEQGVDWTLVGWRALGVPSDTPAEVIETLMKALRDIVASDEFAGFMKAGNYNVSIREGEEARETLDSMDREMGKLLGMPEFKDLEKSGYSKGTYPAILGCALLALLVPLVLGGRKENTEPGGRHSWRGPAVACLGVIGYAVLAPALGFILSAGLLLFSLFLFLGNKTVKSLALAATLSCLVYLVFSTWLRVELPRQFIEW